MSTDLTVDGFLAHVRTLPRRRATLCIGVDGCGGAGKSTLARRLQQRASEIAVVHMDDFYKPSALREASTASEVGPGFDWQRLRDQVLLPLDKNGKAHYQRYDWDLDELAEWCLVAPGGIVIVEGCYSIRTELATLYDFRIWVDAPRQDRLRRGIERDGEEKRHLWELEWMPAEERYIAEHHPDLTADCVIDGSGSRADDLLHFTRPLSRG